ncbi:MAG: acetate--CoA ligase family protein, partial [Streptosporangiales bacterium]
EVHADVLRDAGVPCFAWPARTAEAVGVAVRCGQQLASGDGNGAGASGDRRAPQRLPVAPRTPRRASAALLADLGAVGMLSSGAARALLAEAGIPVIETVRCTNAETAVAAAERVGYPVVAKVDHIDLVHKSDVGGVRLGIDSAEALRAAASELLGLARGAAVLVQHQHDGIEVLVGGLRDPEFGAVVMAGMGGVLVETLRDVQLAVAPVDEAHALGMLRSLRGAAVFDGVRGSAAVDLGAAADVVVQVSELMADNPEIAELDLNPVLATLDGCVAVDWRISTRAPGSAKLASRSVSTGDMPP